jgi:hypothetical protein
MDPNETLARLRELAEKPVSLDVCEEMQGLFDDLDQWLSKGGFKPAAWDPQPQQYKPGFEGAVLAGAVNTPEELDSWKQGGE